MKEQLFSIKKLKKLKLSQNKFGLLKYKKLIEFSKDLFKKLLLIIIKFNMLQNMYLNIFLKLLSNMYQDKLLLIKSNLFLIKSKH